MSDIVKNEQGLVVQEQVKQGWIEESNSDYHKGPGLGSTGIKLLCDTPRHFHKCVVSIDPEVSRIGSLIHSALLEPELLYSRLVVPPSGSRTLKAVKELWEEFWVKLDNQGFLARPLEEVLKLKVADYHTAYNDKCIPVSKEDILMVKRIGETIMEYPSYREKFKGLKELSGHLTVEWKGMEVHCKTRPDVRNPEQGFIMDIKTVHDIKKFEPTFFKLDYHLSAAYYLDLCNILDDGVAFYDTFYWLVIEKKEPYSVKMYKAEIGDLCIEMGRTSYEHGLDLFVDCMRSGRWPGYKELIEPIKVPKYLIQSTI